MTKNDPATEELLDVIVRFGWQLAIALYLIFRPNCWAIDVALRESRSKLTHKQLARQIWIPLLLLCLCQLLSLIFTLTDHTELTLLSLLPVIAAAIYLLVSSFQRKKKT